MKYNIFSHIAFRCPTLSLDQSYKYCINNIIEEGLYLSSTELWQQFKKRETLNQSEKSKLDETIRKYIIRASTRSTPFGVFAGLGLTALKPNVQTKILIKDFSDHEKRVRLDMEYLHAINAHFSKVSEIKENIKYFPNNSIYNVGKEYRYVEKDENNDYNITAIKEEKYLKDIITATKKGMKYSDLKLLVSNSNNITLEDAAIFINELISAQFLISELEIPVTEDKSIEKIVDRLEKVKGRSLPNLRSIEDKLKRRDFSINNYTELLNDLNNTVLFDAPLRKPFHIDLKINTQEAVINEDLVKKIVTQFEEVCSLLGQRTNNDIEAFVESFITKYEYEEVPLSTALDPDMGIGYGKTVSDGVGPVELIEGIKRSEGSFAHTHDTRLDYILKKYNKCTRDGVTILEIEENEIERLLKDEKDTKKLPETASLFGALTINGKGKNGFNFLLKSFSGPSGANLLGRFGGTGNDILSLIKKIISREEDFHKNIIFAEVAHQPSINSGNILSRPALRKYELQYVGKSSLEESNVFSVDDIVVLIKERQVVLKSKSLNKQIVPRLTSAHNFTSKSLPIYKFLCDLQFQGLTIPTGWNWRLLQNMKFLPRVVYKNLILSRAEWRIDSEDMIDVPQSDEELLEYFNVFIKKNNIPSKVVYCEGDNEILIDFNEPFGIKIFLKYLKREIKIRVKEFLFDENNSIIKDTNNKAYVNELIIPVYLDKQIQRPDYFSNKLIRNTNKQQSIFLPLNKWIYLKIYAGPKSIDKVLINLIKYINSKRSKDSFNKFFFTRLKDQFHHLRIRFYTENSNEQKILSELLKYLKGDVDSGLINNIEISTYKRETYRYGDNIAEVESIFHIDSIAAIKLIQFTHKNYNDEGLYRLLVALKSMDKFLSDFGLTLNGKKAFVTRRRDGFVEEFGGNSEATKKMNVRYAKHHKKVLEFLDNESSVLSKKMSIIFNERTIKIKELLDNSRINNKLEPILEGLPNYCHMLINRLFITNQKKYELVVFHYLEKWYASRISRGMT